jgi:predicted phosphodiesterase
MKEKVCVILLCIMISAPTVLQIRSFQASAKKQSTEKEERVVQTIGNLNGQRTSFSSKNQLSFAAYTDTHIGVRYQNPLYRTANYLDRIGHDLAESANLLDFAVHLGDIVHHNTAQVNGKELPWYVNQYKNDVKAYVIEPIKIPFYCVIGNHDVNDYQMNRDDPHNLTKSLIDELSMNTPVHEGILFLSVPELAYVTWTHPVEYAWIEYMTQVYHNSTTVVLCHQTIEDTTREELSEPYRGKQDMQWWANLFQRNPQIKMWIHGHNHILDWYLSNHSTGATNPVYDFGHDMVFSSPYAQMHWGINQEEEDRIVIYNISAAGVETATWANNGGCGHWVSEYLHSWETPTTFDPYASDWYAFPMFLQDNETQTTDMKLLSPDVTVQLIGTSPMDLFYDSYMESPSGWANETILGFGHDTEGNVEWTHPGMRVHGPTYLTFPEKYPYNASVQEDGCSGQPYHSFPMGTICAAVPGQTYNFTMTARCISGDGLFRMNVSCCDWATKSQYSVLPDSEHQVFSHSFNSTFETVSGFYTVPKDNNAWFLQGTLEFLDSADYEISLFRVQRNKTSDTTDDFHLCLSGHWYNVSGVLEKNEMVNFSVNPMHLCTPDGVMNFSAFIQGNRYGIVNIVYREPLLMGMNARFRINSVTNTTYNLSLTKTVSRVSPVAMAIWNSKIFAYFPRITELLVRFLLPCNMDLFCSGFYQKVKSDCSLMYMLFPFSTDSMYEDVEVTAGDGSALRHRSTNGNIWFSCLCPNPKEKFVEVNFQKP